MIYIALIFGLLIGSFINCLVYRIHENDTIFGRSYCPECKNTIRWYDNIPVVSYLILKGKCRFCKKDILIQYPIIELVTGILFAYSFYLNYQFPITNYQLLFIVRDWLLIVSLVALFIYDFRWYILPDILTLPSCIIFLYLNLFLGFSWINILFSGIIGASFFLIQFLISKGKWMGGGDIRLGLLMGLVLARVDLLLVALMFAYFIGSIAGIGLILAGKKKMSSKVPLGVFLTVSTLIALFWGDSIITWYLGLL